MDEISLLLFKGCTFRDRDVLCEKESMKGCQGKAGCVKYVLYAYAQKYCSEGDREICE